MRKILRNILSLGLIAAMLTTPAADAQNRGRRENSKPRTERHGNGRPGNNGNFGNGGNNGNFGSNGNNRPGNHRPGNDRPGNNRPGNTFRPGQPGGQRPPAVRPPVQHRPPAPRPPVHHRPEPPRRHPHGYVHPVPVFHGWHRPVRPAGWVYRGGGPSFSTILGVALGTALSNSLGILVNNGYTVSSYGDNVVYLSNVPQMNYYWPDAALYYNNGLLSGSQFTYSTGYYDMSRYNSLYATFCGQYGAPVNVQNAGGVVGASWFGGDGRFVNLSFSANSNGKYYTTLSFGN